MRFGRDDFATRSRLIERIRGVPAVWSGNGSPPTPVLAPAHRQPASRGLPSEGPGELCPTRVAAAIRLGCSHLRRKAVRSNYAWLAIDQSATVCCHWTAACRLVGACIA